jgi:hypothetical protein
MWLGINSIGIIPENSWNWGQDYSASYTPFRKPDFIPCFGSIFNKQNTFQPVNLIPIPDALQSKSLLDSFHLVAN